jgi:drug/metabolite transporter (DMT)-like permease
MEKKPWLIFALVTTLFWGLWGALMEIPEKAGFPATLGYVVWSITMIPCAVVGLFIIGWKLERDLKSIFYGMIIGLLGAGGQLILFHALVEGPAYLVFPIISLSPAVTVFLSLVFLKETTTRRHWVGIGLALAAILLMSYQEPHGNDVRGYWWFLLAILVFFAWGVQAFFMKTANNRMKAESIFFYMMLAGVVLAPFAILMTDFSADINWGIRGPYLTAAIQSLNAIGALTLVYAIRYGKVIIVAPMTNAVAPVITIFISLIIYAVIPHPVIIAGIILALASVALMATE